EDPPHPAVARLADALLALALPAVVGRRCPARQRRQLAPVLDPTPGEDLPHQDPRPHRADPLEVHPPPPQFHVRLGVAAHRATLLVLQGPDLLIDLLPPRALAEDALPEARRQRRAVPLPQLLQPLGQLGVHHDAQAQRGQQPLDAVGVLGALGLELDQLAVARAAVLLRDGGDTDAAPDLRFAIAPTDEHLHEFGDVEGIGLGPALTAVDLDGGGVDDAVVDAVVDEGAMEPEAVAAGLVAGDDGGLRGESEPVLGPSDLE